MDERNAPATKGDIADSEQRILETMRDIETKLLRIWETARLDPLRGEPAIIHWS